jgi:colanic acid/amylovoran biosynthesis glycosyltransferase
MRVLHFARSFSPLSETFIYDYVTELERQGVDNHVVTFHRKNPEERPFPKIEVVDRPSRWHPRRLWHRALVPFGVGEARTSDWPQTRERLAAVVQRVHPDVIHAHFGPAGVLMGPVAETAGIPLAITMYGYDVSRLAQEEFWRDRYPSTFTKASLLIGISRHICDQIETLGGSSEKISRWHLGVDLSQFEYRPADASFDGQTVQCLHVGRLVEKKSPLDLARAFKHALDEARDGIGLKLTVAGDGPLRPDLEDEVCELGIEKHVSILGSVPHSRVSNLLAQANLYTQHCKTASNGDQEGQGVSFVEAAASGLPIIATRHNGLPDVILDGKTGYLVDEGDVKAMGNKIAQLVETPDQWCSLGKAGRRHIEENFDLQKQAKKMKKKYLTYHLDIR